MKRLARLSFCVAVVMAVARTQVADGAVAYVSVLDDYFSPSTTSIHAGDSVVWTWGADYDAHNVVSEDTPFAWLFPSPDGGPGTIYDQDSSNTENSPYSFTNTFAKAGSFFYQCTLHEFEGMTGTINVTGVAPTPTVAITNLTAGQVLVAPATVTIQASASESGGTIKQVQFLVGSVVLTNCLTPPFVAVTNHLPAGSYTLTAIASDTGGLTATGSVAITVVAASPITNTVPAFATGKTFQFKYSTTAGLSYSVQVSSKLLNWTSLNTNVASTNTGTFTDTNATKAAGYYRVALNPNP
jgi:plastocyanin